MEQELSLHYTLTQNSDSPDIHHNENSNDTVETGDSPHDDIQTEPENKPNQDDYFDPFALEDNNKRFGEIAIDKLTQTQEIDDDDNDDDDIDDEANQNESDKENVDVDVDEDDDHDIDDEDDEELRKEMESNWNKEEKEKNTNIISLFESIRNRHKTQPKSPKRKNGDKYPQPSIKPFVFDGHLKIVFSKTNKMEDREKTAQKQHFHPINTLKTRKKMKNDLKKQLIKKRKKQIKKYRKEFGKEEDYMKETKQRKTHKDTQIKKRKRKQKDEIIEMIENNENEQEEANEDSDIEEMDASKYIEDIVENGDELDEEDLARAALMAKPEVISSEIRELLDIAADEEDENGEIVCDKYEDEYEENFGIAKDLLADKADIKRMKQHQDMYNTKRNEIHQMLMNRDDDNALELMKKAFVDGEYRALQSKAKKRHKYMGILEDSTNDGKNALNIKSRRSESNIYRNEPDYYLSNDEEKNEFCCYDEHGRFYDVNSIRMKIMEWNRNKMDHLLQEDDEEDVEIIKQRKERVRRKEIMSASNESMNIGNNDKINTEDKNAIRLLQKVRNKKMRKKPNLSKSSTHMMGTNFGAFYLEKGLEIPELQRSHSSSFLMHRDKCIEKVKTEESKSRSKGMSSSRSIGKNKHVVFHQKSNNKKRKRTNNDNNSNSNVYKKRRIK